MKLKLRQIVPVAVLHAMDGHVTTRTRMMKLSFLVETHLQNSERELNECVDLSFYPYDYGPYSKTLIDDLRVLDKHGVISIAEKQPGDSKYAYELTVPGRVGFTSVATENTDVQNILTTAEEVVDEYGDLRVRELLDHMYEEYPEYHTVTPYA